MAVERIPAPVGRPKVQLGRWIFDSYYDDYRGVILYVRWLMGELKAGESIRMMATGAND